MQKAYESKYNVFNEKLINILAFKGLNNSIDNVKIIMKSNEEDMKRHVLQFLPLRQLLSARFVNLLTIL